MKYAMKTEVKTLPMMYFNIAVKSALLGEVGTTPKPGLVDMKDNGAHYDMGYQSFVDSTHAIAPYILEMAKEGYYWKGTLSEVFPRIRMIGKKAEAAMYQATDGVNTHKGMIFSMGIISCVSGWYFRQYHRFDMEKILIYAGEMTKRSLKKDFLSIDYNNPKTYGEELFVKYGHMGIRGEVMNGFETVRNISLPLLKLEKEKQNDNNRANLNVLLKIMSILEDTNVLHRSNMIELEIMQNEAARILKLGGADTLEGRKEIEALNETLIQKNISPGGCADLLAITLFAWMLEQYNERKLTVK